MSFFHFDILTGKDFIVSLENSIHVKLYHVMMQRDIEWNEAKVKEMKPDRRLLILGVLFVIVNMAIATQYSVTQIGYEYYLVHPCDADIRYIGSDNTTGGRILRIDGTNDTASLKLVFGTWSTGTNKMYSAVFGIVNEEQYPVNIMYINVSSQSHTYLKIWLHGDRDANANSTSNDPTTVLMYDNGTIVNASNTAAWILAAGNDDPGDMCSNVSDRTNYSTNTSWDETSHVRYSLNDSNAYGVGMMGRNSSNASDFVWVQIAIDIPNEVNASGLHTGTMWIHFEADTNS